MQVVPILLVVAMENKIGDTDGWPVVPLDESDNVVYGVGTNKPGCKDKGDWVSTALVVVLVVALLVCSFVGGMIYSQFKVDASEEKHFAENVHASGVENAGANAATYSEIINAKANTRYFVPMYMQWDSQWANVEYGSGTLSDTGCGLCCGAMAVQILTGTTCTPDELVSLSHGATLSDGVNDMGKMVDFIYRSWGAETKIQKTQEILDVGVIAEMVNNDWIAFGSCHGYFGDMETSESGHIVLIYDVDENGFYIRDPYCITNNRQFSFDEFYDVQWDFFRCMKGEHVVRRH